MHPIADRRAQGFSQGERMKLALARAIINDPPNIILDEPANGQDVASARALRTLLERFRDVCASCARFESADGFWRCNWLSWRRGCPGTTCFTVCRCARISSVAR
jgi:hypothetical protein